MNPPEMIVDDIYSAGCFEITDLSLLGEGAEFDNVAGFKPTTSNLKFFWATQTDVSHGMHGIA